MLPWLIQHKRLIEYHYVNAWNETLSEVFNCNINIQVGEPCHLLYTNLYNLKSIEKEGSERQQQIFEAIVWNLVWI